MSETDSARPPAGQAGASTGAGNNLEPKPEEEVEDSAEVTGQSETSAQPDRESVHSGVGSTVAESARIRPARGGRLLAFFALIVSLGAGGAAAYLYYLMVFNEPLAPIESRFADVESRAQQQTDDLNRLRVEQADALAEFTRAQRAEAAASSDRLLEAMNAITSQAPPSPREWKVAEVAYLLRIANHRLLMERDTQGALGLLSAADVILTELDDFIFYQVRANLADEILALKNVESNDVQGLYLRLEAVKGEISALPLKLPRYQQEQATEETGESTWDALISQLSSYLRFRRFDGTVKPLLAPEEAVYLELNLRLMLERAQLAALRREQVVYEQSINTASQWVVEYLDQDLTDVSRVVSELDALEQVDLKQTLPDISGSLAALKAVGIVDP